MASMVMVDMAMAGTDTEQKKIDTGMNSVYHVLNNYGKNRIYYKYKKENQGAEKNEERICKTKYGMRDICSR
ncbi:MAG: hypothetical protein U0K31_10285 [Blautia sp.]|nr:hypothetical protein [Blautia sp.]